MADQTIQTLHSFLKDSDTKVSSGGTVKAYSHDHGSGPILCMVHGWPESSYMFEDPSIQCYWTWANISTGGVTYD